MIRVDVFRMVEVAFLKRRGEPQIFTLPAGSATHLAVRPAGQRNRILSGCAWITWNGKDILLETGQQTQLPRWGMLPSFQPLAQSYRSVKFLITRVDNLIQRNGSFFTSATRARLLQANLWIEPIIRGGKMFEFDQETSGKDCL